MLAGHAAARVIRRAGIPWVSGVPGESFLPLLDGLREEGLPFVVTAHESGAAFLATGYARASGYPALVAVTRGPGASNALIGIHEAFQGATPLVVIVGQIESRIRGRGALQEMEFTQLFQSAAKAVFEVTSPEQVAPAIVAALRKAAMGRPGPVVVSVPADHFYGDVDASDVPPAVSQPRWVPGVLSNDSVGQLADLIERADRGLFLIGSPFAGKRAVPLLAELATVSGFGIVGGHAFPDALLPDHPQWLGCSTIRGSATLRRILTEADVVISLGQPLGDRVTQGYVPLSERLVVIAPDAEVGWDEYLGAQFYTADPLAAAGQLIGALVNTSNRSPRCSARLEWVAERRSELQQEQGAIFDRAQAERGPFLPFPAILDALDEVLPDDCIVVSDAGSFNDWVTRYFPFRGARSYYGPLSGSMGFSLPAGIGVHRAQPEKRVCVLTGDGGFLMTGMELTTAARLNTPMMIVVFVNGVHGSIALHQDRRFPGRRFGLDIADSSLAAFADSAGVLGIEVNTPDELRPALQAGLRHDGPSLIAIPTDPVHTSPSSFETGSPIVILVEERELSGGDGGEIRDP